MKFLNICLAFIFFTTASFGQDRAVYDHVLEDAALDEYQTYAIGDLFTGSENQEWVKYSSLLNGMIENSVIYELDTYDFDMKGDEAELLINFMVFDEAYNDKIGYMPGFRVEDTFGNDENILNKLEDGSLVISMVDVTEGATIWTGFVPNAVDKDASLREQQKDIRQSVSAAMETFMAKANFNDSPSNRFDMVTDPVDDVAPEDDDSNR
ncbi:DUF4136 domain-containing protein [Catalinimonas niigatensis]|uniref:DUF4136 domain-containing protein n=1 Tax=Catalinimonas niigatensis TaxID=1397264 RepID=UPI0026657071|nr:DUF4136 domain-containing protein [Catalinimonas niigatensis]WPP51212.1 DUF4136 domain-containing protein [Catalinimonas niigatensis]